MKRKWISALCIISYSLTCIAQQHQEQAPALLQKEKIKRIEYVYSKDSHASKKKSDFFYPTGYRHKSVIYQDKNIPNSTYVYNYRNDNLLKEVSYFKGKDTLSASSSHYFDYDPNGQVIQENFSTGGKFAGAYNTYEYNKKGQLTKKIHKRNYMVSMLQKLNNLWVRQTIPLTEETRLSKDRTPVKVKVIDPESSLFETTYSYHKDGKIKETQQVKPYKLKTTYEYNDKGLNTAQYLEEGKEKKLIFKCSYNNETKVDTIFNYFTEPTTVLTNFDFIEMKNGDELKTIYHYLPSGLIDYQDQYLNGIYLGKLEYLYFR